MRAADDLADALHAGRVDDVLLEGVVDDRAGRHDVELVDRRIDVAGDAHPKAGLLEQLAGIVADDRVAAVHDDRPQRELAEPAGVGQHRLAVAALDTAGQQDEARARLLDVAQIVVAQQPGRLVGDDRTRPQRGFAGGHGRHALGEAVDGHAQATGG